MKTTLILMMLAAPLAQAERACESGLVVNTPQGEVLMPNAEAKQWAAAYSARAIRAKGRRVIGMDPPQIFGCMYQVETAVAVSKNTLCVVFALGPYQGAIRANGALAITKVAKTVVRCE